MSDWTGKPNGSAVHRPFCHLCGEPIVGQGQVFRHHHWSPGLLLRVCNTCAANQPRCQVCNLPVAQTVGVDSIHHYSRDHLCDTCRKIQESPAGGASSPITASLGVYYRNASQKPGNNQSPSSTPSPPVCLSCGNPVHGRYLEFDGVGPYCQKCYKERQPCDVCSAPLTNEQSGGQWILSDGRVMCAHCHATAVFSAYDASVLYEDMKTVAAQILGLKLNIPTGLAMVDRNQLVEVIRQQQVVHPNQSGSVSNPLAAEQPLPQTGNHLDPQRTLGLYARRGMRRGIYVQTGLPRLLFLQIAAHEFAHAWQGENCPLLRQPLVHEGFAEWVSYRVMEFYGYDRGRQRMLDRDDIYGQGLRWALDLDNRCGAQAVLQACRTAVGETVKTVC